MASSNHSSVVDRVSISSVFRSASEWSFPHSTCEAFHYDAWVMQPYSALLTAATCVTVFWMMIAPRRWSNFTCPNRPSAPVSTLTRFSLLPLVVFEAFHAYSHTVHFLPSSSSSQLFVQHCLGYGMAFVIFSSCYRRYGISTNQKWILPVVTCDLFYWHFSGIGSMIPFLGLSIMVAIIMSYYPVMEYEIRRRIAFLSVNTMLLAAQIVHESVACQWWVHNLSPHFPYHILIEGYGLYLFVYLADTFFLLDTMIGRKRSKKE